MENESRANMVRSAASLISEHGVNATSFSDVLADSGAPRGSIYHHFPDGKKQLTEEAMTLTSERVLAYLRAGTGTTSFRSARSLHFNVEGRGGTRRRRPRGAPSRVSPLIGPTTATNS